MGRPDGEQRRRLEVPNLKGNIISFESEVVGQDHVAESFAALLSRIRSGVRSRKPTPIDSKFLLGPSGVGKTKMVYRLAEVLSADFPDENGDLSDKVIRLDGAQFTTEARVNGLIGSPPGYANSKGLKDEVEPLLGRNNLNSHCIYYLDHYGRKQSVVIVLLDEVEKADTSLDGIMLAIMDQGDITLNDNTHAFFGDVVLFFTSNAGNKAVNISRTRKLVRGKVAKGLEVFDKAFSNVDLDPQAIAEYEERYREVYRDQFSDEFRGRVREVLVFRPLEREQLQKIAGLMITEIAESFGDSDINIGVTATPEVLEWLVDKSYDPSEGARALHKFIQRVITEPMSAISSAEDLNYNSIVIQLADHGKGLEFYIDEQGQEELQTAEA